MILVYCVTAHVAEAEKIGKHLLEQHLCACVNIIPGMKSMYWWEGKIEHAEESILLIKTIPEKYAAVEAAILEMHNYERPAIFSFETQQIEPFFEKWLGEGVK